MSANPRRIGTFRSSNPDLRDFTGCDLYRDANVFMPCPNCGSEWGKTYYTEWSLRRPKREYNLGKCNKCGYRYVIDNKFDIQDSNTGEPASIIWLSSDGEWYITEVFENADLHRDGIEKYLIFGCVEYYIFATVLMDGSIVMNANGSFEDDPSIYDGEIPPEVIRQAIRILGGTASRQKARRKT